MKMYQRTTSMKNGSIGGIIGDEMVGMNSDKGSVVPVHDVSIVMRYPWNARWQRE